jgi:hypothetical protein
MPIFSLKPLISFYKFMDAVAVPGSRTTKTAALRQILPVCLRPVNHKRAKLGA